MSGTTGSRIEKSPSTARTPSRLHDPNDERELKIYHSPQHAPPPHAKTPIPPRANTPPTTRLLFPLARAGVGTSPAAQKRRHSVGSEGGQVGEQGPPEVQHQREDGCLEVPNQGHLSGGTAVWRRGGEWGGA